MTKIDIISGFLGAGKTTLIKKLIEEVFVGEKLVLIENEFGEIGIDGGFLKEAGIQITEMNSGCICCSLVGDFGTALQEVLDKFSPDRILIEPSGVGKLSDVIKAVQGVQENTKEIELNSFVTVADVTKCKMYMKNFGEFFNNQIEHANTIILSRTQKTTPEKLETAVKEIRKHNEKASIITTSWDELNGKQILAAMEKQDSLIEELFKEETCHHEEHEHKEECGCHHEGHDHKEECGCQHEGHDHKEECDCQHEGHDHKEECGCHHEGHHHADDVFTSWGAETPHKYTDQEVEHALAVLSQTQEYGSILRAKGILPNVNGQWIYFDFVPGEYEVRTGSADYTGRLCVIGIDLQISKIEALFHI